MSKALQTGQENYWDGKGLRVLILNSKPLIADRGSIASTKDHAANHVGEIWYIVTSYYSRETRTCVVVHATPSVKPYKMTWRPTMFSVEASQRLKVSDGKTKLCARRAASGSLEP